MWRNSKRSSAGLGLELPPRTLTLIRLHFTPAEHTFYSHILEKTREARDALHHHEHQSNADSAGPSIASPNQSGECASGLMVHHMRVIMCRIPNMKNALPNMRNVLLCCAVLCCAVLCCAVLCCAVLCRAVLCPAETCCAAPCCAVPDQPLDQLVCAQASLHIGLNAFMTPPMCLQKLTSVTCLVASATCPRFTTLKFHMHRPHLLCNLLLGNTRHGKGSAVVGQSPHREAQYTSHSGFSSINANRRSLVFSLLLVQSGGGCQQPAKLANSLRGRRGR